MTSRDRSAPLFYVTVLDGAGNEQLVVDQSHRIESLEYTDSEKKADKLVLQVDNFDLSNLDDQLWRKGNELQVTWGYPGRTAPTRSAIITRVTGSMVLHVEARAKSVLMNTITRARTFENVKRSDVVRQLAQENGWTDDQQLFIEDTEIVFPTISQARMTDAQFIKRLAHLEGWEFYIDFDGFHFHERKLDQKPLKRYIWYTDWDGGDVLNFNIEEDVLRKPARVTTQGEDLETGEEVSATADNETDEDRPVLGDYMAAFNEDAEFIGMRRIGETEATPSAQAGSPGNAAEAAAREARGRFRQATRLSVKMTIDAVGDPTQLAKSIIDFQGIGTRLSGKYYVAEVTHRVGPGDYGMTMKAIKDSTGAYERRVVREGTGGLPEVQPTPASGSENDQDTADENALVPFAQVNEDGEITRFGYQDSEGRFVTTEEAIRRVNEDGAVIGGSVTRDPDDG